jgi:Domain of unknown function (DUF4180)
MAVVRQVGGRTVLVADAHGLPLDATAIKDLLLEGHAAGAAWLVVETVRLEPAFFDLRSGVAGEILQATVTYQLPLAIIGPLPEPAASSSAFAALVRESNRGSHHWFAGSLEQLEARFAGRE